MRERYDPLFRDDYQLEKDAELEKAIATINNITSKTVKDGDVMCKDLVAFIANVRANHLVQ